MALGEESFFPECLGSGARGRGCLPRVFRLLRSGKRVSSPSVWAAALGEEGVFSECCTRGRFFFKKKKERRKRRRLLSNDVNCSPSVRTAFGKAFPECTIFGSWGRRLSRKEIPRTLFPECCTRGRLPRVQLGLPRVHLTLGEVTASRSDQQRRMCREVAVDASKPGGTRGENNRGKVKSD